jgi:hypothetical protein
MGRVELGYSAPRPQEEVAVTTLGNYSFALQHVSSEGHTECPTNLPNRKLDDFDTKLQNQSETAIQISPLALGSSGEQRPEESLNNMLFDGAELRDIIDRTPDVIELRNEHGRCCGILSRAEVLALDLDLFVGIGNRRRIRFLRWRTRKFAVNAGSHTTQRLKGKTGVNIAHPLVREHRPVRSK